MSNEKNSNSISDIFDVLFNRKEEKQGPSPKERALKVVESYKLDALMQKTIVDKLTTFEQEAEDQKSDAEQMVKDAAEAVKAEEEKAQKAQDVKNAAKAVALRARTLGTEVKVCREKAEQAKAEAEVKVKELQESTKQAKAEGNALVAGLTDQRFTLEAAAEMSEEEFNQLFNTVTSV